MPLSSLASESESGFLGSMEDEMSPLPSVALTKSSFAPKSSLAGTINKSYLGSMATGGGLRTPKAQRTSKMLDRLLEWEGNSHPDDDDELDVSQRIVASGSLKRRRASSSRSTDHMNSIAGVDVRSPDLPNLATPVPRHRPTRLPRSVRSPESTLDDFSIHPADDLGLLGAPTLPDADTYPPAAIQTPREKRTRRSTGTGPGSAKRHSKWFRTEEEEQCWEEDRQKWIKDFNAYIAVVDRVPL